MKTVVVDTNVLIRFLAGEERYRHAFDAYGRILVPSVVVGEFKCGTDGKTAKGRQQKKALETFLAKACVELISMGEKESDWYAEVFQVLKRQGTPVPQNDMWIAATALSHGAPLLSDDAHFGQMPMVRLV